MSCWLDSLLEPVEVQWEWGAAMKSLIRRLLSGKVCPERFEAVPRGRWKAELWALWVPGEALEPTGERGLRALRVLSQLVTAVHKDRDLPGLKSGETKVLNMPYLWALPLVEVYLLFTLLLQGREVSAVCQAFTAWWSFCFLPALFSLI